MPESGDLTPLITEILNSRKYRSAGINEETVRDLLVRELAVQRNQKEALKETRRKLHNIIAPYLGDPDYPAAAQQLQGAYAQADPAKIKQTCAKILSEHASTRERVPVLDNFYREIFALTGQPSVILDLACALNPLSFPWMNLPASTYYYAYDIHAARVAFLNQFFALAGLPELAISQDILVNPPEVEADVVFLFKEVHRFEQRQRGCNRPLWDALKTRWLLISLPTENLTGHHSLVERHRKLVYDILGDRPWPVHELVFDQEIVFCLEKGHGA